MFRSLSVTFSMPITPASLHPLLLLASVHQVHSVLDSTVSPVQGSHYRYSDSVWEILYTPFSDGRVDIRSTCKNHNPPSEYKITVNMVAVDDDSGFFNVLPDTYAAYRLDFDDAELVSAFDDFWSNLYLNCDMELGGFEFA
ncbi:hypothetical protein FOZ63_014130, partial [Perkinsus olseni]